MIPLIVLLTIGILVLLIRIGGVLSVLWLFFSGAMLFLLLEGTLAFALSRSDSIPGWLLRNVARYIYLFDERSTIQLEPECASYDSELFYKLKPGACRFQNAEFSTEYRINSLGLRDDEESLRRPEIIALGDSMTMGWGVEQDETYPQILEHLTSKKTLNAGVSSYGTARELLLLNHLDTSALQTLVILYLLNDAEENLSVQALGYHYVPPSRNVYDHLVHFNHMKTRYWLGKYCASSFTFLYCQVTGKIPEENELRAGTRPKVPQATLEEQADLLLDLLLRSKLAKMPVVQVVLMDGLREQSILEHVRRNPRFRSLESSVHKVVLLPLTDVLDKSDFYTLDDHPRASGQRKIAEKLRSTLR